MKICELKIQNYADRNNVLVCLANAGYKVSIDIRRHGYYDYEGVDYFVVVEEFKERAEK